MKNTARRGGDIFIISEPTAMLFTSAQLNSSIAVTLFAVLAISQRLMTFLLTLEQHYVNI